MKGIRQGKGAPPSTDLLVCFPSRARLTLMPKPMCSPVRPPDQSNKRHHRHRVKKSHTRCSSSGGGQAAASPILWAKSKSMGLEISEPTSPKVTCAGQIKVRPKTSPCKSWQSVMEEIERIHQNRNHRKKKPMNWIESLGLKKDLMQLLTCLRSVRFHCFKGFPELDIPTNDEEDEDSEGEDDKEFQENQSGGVNGGRDGNEASSRTLFSKWFTVLQENREERSRPRGRDRDSDVFVSRSISPPPPPPNALLLMRCRSAPAKSWIEEEEKGEEDEGDEEVREGWKEVKMKSNSLRSLMDEESKKTERLVVMKYEHDMYKISPEIAKETWINVGGLSRDPFLRSRSWKR